MAQDVCPDCGVVHSAREQLAVKVAALIPERVRVLSAESARRIAKTNFADEYQQQVNDADYEDIEDFGFDVFLVHASKQA